MVRKIAGKQLATGVNGLRTSNLSDGILSADAEGRAKIENGFFDSATANTKFADGALDATFCANKIVDGAIPLSKLAQTTAQIISINDKSKFVASPTTGDNANTGLIVSGNPVTGTFIMVVVAGLMRRVADGPAEKAIADCYFSPDDGTTVRSYGQVQSGDTLFWNGLIAGFDLATNTRVDFIYLS